MDYKAEKKLKKELKRAFRAGMQVRAKREFRIEFREWYDRTHLDDGKANMPSRTAYKFGYSTWENS